MKDMMRIGQLAAIAGTTPPTVRYYEQIGLLPSGPRGTGSQRVYGEADVRQLAFIRRSREFGFSIEQVRQLASLQDCPERSCLEARNLAHTHLLEVRQKLAELNELERCIAEVVSTCDQSCAGSASAECVILEELSSSRPISGAQTSRHKCCGGL